MPVQKTDKIWHNGRFIDWDDATIHIMFPSDPDLESFDPFD